MIVNLCISPRYIYKGGSSSMITSTKSVISTNPTTLTKHTTFVTTTQISAIATTMTTTTATTTTTLRYIKCYIIELKYTLKFSVNL